MVKHIVVWKMNPPGDKAAHGEIFREFCGKLEHLKSIIPEIVDARAGHSYLEGDVFNLCIDSVFRTREDVDIYINHPEHLKVRDYLNSVTCEKIVFDYEY